MRLITGANGQVGRALYARLVEQFGEENVLATDLRSSDVFHRYENLDITDVRAIDDLLSRHEVTEIYHLAAVLSASAEADPERAWNVNMSGLLHMLNASLKHSVKRVFFPSSIAVFGSGIHLGLVRQLDVQHPLTQYGISKSAGENWCQYYATQYGLDVRSLRYPGIIGPKSLPGGGTTDYAVHVFHDIIKQGAFECYLAPDSVLPMIYMDDAMDATLQLMQAPASAIRIRTSYNIQALSFSPSQLFDEIRKHYPQASMSFKPDHRQGIADYWPDRLDDMPARTQWGWQPRYGLSELVSTMFQELTA